MALQGTLDTFALADVLRLLAATSKSGRLRIDADRGPGSVWLTDGSVVGGTVDAEFDDTVGVVFQLLRAEQGDFEFVADDVADDAHDPMSVDEVIEQAEARLADWREVEAVVPSLWRHVAPSAELPEDEVVVDRSGWATLMAVGEGRTVAAVGERLTMGELDVSRAVRALVDAGLVSIGDDDVVVDEPFVAEDFVVEPLVPETIGTDDDFIPPSDFAGDGIFDDLVAELDRDHDLDQIVRDEVDGVDGVDPDSFGGSRDVDLDEALDAGHGAHDYLEGDAEATMPEPLPAADELGPEPEPMAEAEPAVEAVADPLPEVVDEVPADETVETVETVEAVEESGDPFAHEADPEHADDHEIPADQLAQLSPKAAEAIAAAAGDPKGKSRANRGSKPKPEEPMNRSLLQKFISSK